MVQLNRLLLVVDAGVEVADGAVEEQFEFEVRDGGEPLFEGALFAEAAKVGPIVEDEDSAVGEARAEIVEAIERG